MTILFSHRKEDCWECGDCKPRHHAGEGLGGGGPGVLAGGGHQADQQRVEERGDTLGSQRAPERQRPGVKRFNGDIKTLDVSF